MFGEPDVERLWEAYQSAVRLDQPDPVAAWQTQSDKLIARAKQLDEHAFDAIHFDGPGTDLTVGLLPGARWMGGGGETVDGIFHVAEPPDRGGLHRTRLAPHRGDGALDQAARARGDDRRGARDALRGGEGGRGEGVGRARRR